TPPQPPQPLPGQPHTRRLTPSLQKSRTLVTSCRLGGAAALFSRTGRQPACAAQRARPGPAARSCPTALQPTMAASCFLTCAADGLVSAVPSGNRTVGTVWLPPFTDITNSAAASSRS